MREITQTTFLSLLHAYVIVFLFSTKLLSHIKNIHYHKSQDEKISYEICQDIPHNCFIDKKIYFNSSGDKWMHKINIYMLLLKTLRKVVSFLAPLSIP